VPSSVAAGVYVQYGCGASSPPGWLNFDASPTLRLQCLPGVGRLFRNGVRFPDGARYGDICKGLPLADGAADGIYASHVLEHLSLADFTIAVRNTFRLLKPGGLFRLVVPDLAGRARLYLQRLDRADAQANSSFMRSAGLGAERRGQGITDLARAIFGNTAHRWMWDETSLTAALREAGFIDIRRCRFNDCADPAFRAVEDASRFFDPVEGIAECAIEARKPASAPTGNCVAMLSAPA
jgi:SAM-dependent methyltransferase